MLALTTTRLSLMPWQDAFGEDLARLASDQRVMRYIGDGRPWNREQASQRHQACLTHWEDHDFGWRDLCCSRSSQVSRLFVGCGCVTGVVDSRQGDGDFC
jgi:RimJ/RimL family protein N-acetyltransferase